MDKAVYRTSLPVAANYHLLGWNDFVSLYLTIEPYRLSLLALYQKIITDAL